MNHKETQNTRLLKYLRSGRSITRAQAFSKLGICELSSRIGEIQAQNVISREPIRVNGHRVVRYWLT